VKRSDGEVETGPDRVTFRVNRWYKGDRTPVVTLKVLGFGRATSAGSIAGAVGDRMLVAGDDEFAWPCGFTQTYDSGVAAEWETALG
jgi:hypothetical protein